MKVLVLLILVSGQLVAACRHLPPEQSGQQLPSPTKAPPQLTHAVLQDQQQTFAHRSDLGTASDSSRLHITTHAKPAWTWGVAIAAARPSAHRHFKRQLTAAQDGMMDTQALAGRDTLLQASSALVRTRINAAVESGAAMETTSAASIGRDVPLRRALLQGGGGGSGIITGSVRGLLQDNGGTGTILTDSLRGAASQERAAASVSMIRSAAAGEVDVADAIRRAQAAPRGGVFGSAVVAERIAGRAATLSASLP